MSAHVLVVDDDTDVLAGMRRGLWRYRERFTCEFVASGREAMARLLTDTFAVALVDLEMPDIDGTALLAHLKAEYPGIVRIAFSGSCEARRCLDAMALAHRFIDKPCTTDRLVQHIEACLREGGAGVRVAVGLEGLAEPQMLPGVYHEAVAALADESCSTRQLATILHRDIGATTRLLKLANSSFWSPARPITDVDKAVTALGRDIVRASLLLLGLANGLAGDQGRWVDGITSHGLAVSSLAPELVDDRRTAGTARTAGLLHDVGRVVLARSAAHDYTAAMRSAVDEVALVAAEREAFGVDHATVAGFLLELWGLPAAVAQAVARHHEPAQQVDIIDAPQAVRLAELVVSGGIDELNVNGGCTPACLVRARARVHACSTQRERATGT